jgi:hypothetical protein
VILIVRREYSNQRAKLTCLTDMKTNSTSTGMTRMLDEASQPRVEGPHHFIPPFVNRAYVLRHFVLGMFLCNFLGCAHSPRKAESDLSYNFMATVLSPAEGPLLSLQAEIFVDRPFAIQVQDREGHGFRISGRLRQRSEAAFAIEGLRMIFELAGTDNRAGFSISMSSSQLLELDKPQEGRGIHWYGYRFTLTRKSTVPNQALQATPVNASGEASSVGSGVPDLTVRRH